MMSSLLCAALSCAILLNMMIRRVQQEDFEQWFRLRLALWPEASQPEDKQEMQDYLSSDTRAISVAQATDGHLSGFLETNIRYDAEDRATRNVGYIEGWYVNEEHRQRGIGAALVKAAEDWARSKGCKELASDGLLDNEISVAAHLALGYEETSRLIHFVKSL